VLHITLTISACFLLLYLQQQEWRQQHGLNLQQQQSSSLQMLASSVAMPLPPSSLQALPVGIELLGAWEQQQQQQQQQGARGTAPDVMHILQEGVIL